ncbi:MAG: hypothetical protein IKN63_01780 [Bacilli bacterium]|nr:hypothetical protein [Bacilli bacterium]
MKKVIWFFILIIIFLLTINYKEKILTFYNNYFESKNFIPTTLENNEYSRNYNFNYVELTDNFLPKTKQDIMNIYYTVINSGMNEFTFYCKSEYENCLKDVKDIANNQVTISNINNFVHPFNGFKDLETEIDSIGKITLHINRNYTNENIILLNYEVDKIINKNITSNMSNKEKIKVIHDYIIDNIKYDNERSDKNNINYQSDTAYGALMEGHALCGGYTDAMMLFLEKFNIKSYKKSSENHIWNYVYLDNKWYNLDLTWDDPVTLDGRDLLEYNFYLINNDELLKLDKTEHTFDKTVYSE